MTLETENDERTVRVHDDEGELDVDDATFRFAVRGNETASETSGEDGDGVDDTDSFASEETTDPKSDPHYLAAVEDIPTNGTLRFEVYDGQYGVEGILQRTDGDVLAWENSCPHEPEVRLDKGFGALVNDGQLVCHKHGARFDCDDGFCTRGPCRGSMLDAIEVEVRDETVFLADERFEAGHCLDN
nr:Rieske 2Fe-2S domain-containing protein [Halogranum amylolyticum]